MKQFFFLLLLAVAGIGTAQAQVTVVAHPGLAETAADANTLLDIYTLEQAKWSDGTRVVTLTLDDDAAADAFYGALGRGLGSVKKVWLRKKLSGEGQPPEVVGSAAEMIAKVAATPGAVGFVPAGTDTGDAKVLGTLP